MNAQQEHIRIHFSLEGSRNLIKGCRSTDNIDKTEQKKM